MLSASGVINVHVLLTFFVLINVRLCLNEFILCIVHSRDVYDWFHNWVSVWISKNHPHKYWDIGAPFCLVEWMFMEAHSDSNFVCPSVYPCILKSKFRLRFLKLLLFEEAHFSYNQTWNRYTIGTFTLWQVYCFLSNSRCLHFN